MLLQLFARLLDTRSSFIETFFAGVAGKGSNENWHNVKSCTLATQISAAFGYFEIPDDKNTDTATLREQVKQKYRRLR